MNEHTAALLQGLAAKLGTTSEYLWAILLKQAPVYAYVALFQYAVTVLVLVALFRYRIQVGKFLTTLCEETEALGVIGLIVIGIASIIWLLACVFAFESVVTAFVNPEYWALDKVLDTIKAKK